MATIHITGLPAPMTVPKIVCVGRNYRKHAAEMKAEVPTEPVLFLKPSSAIIRPGGNIVFPSFSTEMEHEVELVVAIGKAAKRVSPSEAWGAVAGYAVGLDMTLRDVQAVAKQKGLPWAVAKGFPTSAPLSDFIPASSVGSNPVFEIECAVNGVVKQRTSTTEMIFDIGRLVSYVSGTFGLEPGDLVFTGTPEGVGPVRPGDTIEARLFGQTTGGQATGGQATGGLASTRHTIVAA